MNTNFSSRIATLDSIPPREGRPAAFFIKKRNPNLIITLPSSNGYGVLGELTNRIPNVDHLFLSCGDQAWMTQGVPLVTSDLLQTVELVREQIRDYEKVCLLGSSCGGYLALVMGILAKPHSIVAFDPHLIPLSLARDWTNPKEWRDVIKLATDNKEVPLPPKTWVLHGSGEEDSRKAKAIEATGYKMTRIEVENAATHGRAMRVMYEGDALPFQKLCREALL